MHKPLSHLAVAGLIAGGILLQPASAQDNSNGNGKNKPAEYTITIGGAEFTQADSKGLEAIMIEEHIDMIGTVQMTFGEASDAWSSLELGADVEVKIGGSDYKVFVGYLANIRHDYSRGHGAVTLIAMDPLVKLSGVRSTQIWEEWIDSDVASELISASGAPASVQDTGITRSSLLQYRESDFEFIQRIAEQNDFIFYASAGRIYFEAPDFDGPPSAQLTADEIESFSVSIGIGHVPVHATSYGWDYVSKKIVEGRAKQDQMTIVFQSREDAAAEMQARMNGGVRGRAILDLRGDIHAPGRIMIQNPNTGNSRKVYVTTVRHIIDRQGKAETYIEFAGR